MNGYDQTSPPHEKIVFLFILFYGYLFDEESIITINVVLKFDLSVERIYFYFAQNHTWP